MPDVFLHSLLATAPVTHVLRQSYLELLAEQNLCPSLSVYSVVVWNVMGIRDRATESQRRGSCVHRL
jgi:hypothetical protein